MPSRRGQDITKNPSDTSLLMLVPFRESPLAPISLLSESLELRILISHFPRDHTDTRRRVLPRSDLLKASAATHQFTGAVKKPGDLQELGNHQNQPTFEMLWVSRTCCRCIMLHWLKRPQASAATFLAQWSFGKMGQVKRTIPVGLECLRPLPTNCVYFTLQLEMTNPSQRGPCQFSFKVGAASKDEKLSLVEISAAIKHHWGIIRKPKQIWSLKTRYRGEQLAWLYPKVTVKSVHTTIWSFTGRCVFLGWDQLPGNQRRIQEVTTTWRLRITNTR